jgi:Spy/CpxP family protein refolding chaperone
MKKTIIVAALFAAFSFTAQAQETGKGHRHGGGKVYQQLNLTSEQKESFKNIHKDAKEKREAIRNNSSLTESQKQEQYKQLKKDQHAKTEALLTNEQKTKLKELKKQHKPGKAAKQA